MNSLDRDGDGGRCSNHDKAIIVIEDNGGPDTWIHSSTFNADAGSFIGGHNCAVTTNAPHRAVYACAAGDDANGKSEPDSCPFACDAGYILTPDEAGGGNCPSGGKMYDGVCLMTRTGLNNDNDVRNAVPSDCSAKRFPCLRAPIADWVIR